MSVIIVVLGLQTAGYPADADGLTVENIARSYRERIQPLLKAYGRCRAECDLHEERGATVSTKRLILRASEGRTRLVVVRPAAGDGGTKKIHVRTVNAGSASFSMRNSPAGKWGTEMLSDGDRIASEMLNEIQNEGFPLFAHTCYHNVDLHEFFQELEIRHVVGDEEDGERVVRVTLGLTESDDQALPPPHASRLTSMTMTLLLDHHCALKSLERDLLSSDTKGRERRFVMSMRVVYQPDSLRERDSVPVIQSVEETYLDASGETLLRTVGTVKAIDFAPVWSDNEFSLGAFDLVIPRIHRLVSRTYYLSILLFLALALIGGWLLRRHSGVPIAASSGSVAAGDIDWTGPPGNPPLDGTNGEPAP